MWNPFLSPILPFIPPDNLSYHQDLGYPVPYASPSHVCIFSPDLSPESQIHNSNVLLDFSSESFFLNISNSV